MTPSSTRLDQAADAGCDHRPRCVRGLERGERETLQVARRYEERSRPAERFEDGIVREPPQQADAIGDPEVACRSRSFGSSGPVPTMRSSRRGCDAPNAPGLRPRRRSPSVKARVRHTRDIRRVAMVWARRHRGAVRFGSARHARRGQAELGGSTDGPARRPRWSRRRFATARARTHRRVAGRRRCRARSPRGEAAPVGERAARTRGRYRRTPGDVRAVTPWSRSTSRR